MAIDIITKVHNGNGHGEHEELSPNELDYLDLTTQNWQKLMRDHKTLFAKMYEMRIQEGLSHIQAINSIFKEMD
jgi:hypothetical protein